MRILAFDYGTKRVGIAVTDPLQIIATALITLHPEKLFPFLEDYLKKEEVERFVVGIPQQMDSTPSQSAQHITGFIRKLAKQFPHIPIEKMDERFTSKMAEASLISGNANAKQRKDKGLVDSIAATIILQSYLERKSLQGL